MMRFYGHVLAMFRRPSLTTIRELVQGTVKATNMAFPACVDRGPAGIQLAPGRLDRESASAVP